MELSESLEISIEKHYKIIKSRNKFEENKKKAFLLGLGILYLIGVRTLPIISYKHYLEGQEKKIEQIYKTENSNSTNESVFWCK